MLSHNIIFMVYDSRSGSTFLSKLISSNLDETIVTPEIGYEEILKRSDKNLKGYQWSIIIKKMIIKGDLRNSNASYTALFNYLGETKEAIGAEKIFDLLVTESISDFSGKKNIIIKNGRHIKYLNNLSKLVKKKAKILYVYRDPRAVISSKLMTNRPYYPKEVMAWGGAALAALQWRKYNQYIKIEKNRDRVTVCGIAYEEVIHNQFQILAKIAKFMGANITAGDSSVTSNIYKIPPIEQNIHRLALSNVAITSRQSAWKTEISKFRIKQIEAITYNDMNILGYTHENKLSVFHRMFITAISMPEILVKIIIHYKYMITGSKSW